MAKRKTELIAEGAGTEPLKGETMMLGHTLTYNCQQQSAEGQWLAGF